MFVLSFESPAFCMSSSALSNRELVQMPAQVILLDAASYRERIHWLSSLAQFLHRVLSFEVPSFDFTSLTVNR
jgi:hypothetical protein